MATSKISKSLQGDMEYKTYNPEAESGVSLAFYGCENKYIAYVKAEITVASPISAYGYLISNLPKPINQFEATMHTADASAILPVYITNDGRLRARSASIPTGTYFIAVTYPRVQ